MESLIKQTRSKFGVSKQDRSSSTTDKKTPPQKTESFRDKKRNQSWMKKQFSRQMSWEYDFSSTEYPTSVAAAAYAIQSLEESNYWDKKYGRHKSLNKTKSRVDETDEKPEPLKSALKPTDETSKASFNDEGSTSMSRRLPERKPTKKVSFGHMDEISNSKAEKLPSEEGPERAPSFQRPPTPRHLNMADSRRPEAALPRPELPTVRPPTAQPVQPTNSMVRKPSPADSAADAWEKEEMISIQERYEKLRETIDNWESKKKKKARRKIQGTEADLGKSVNKAIRKYDNEIARIQAIAGGARSQAEENRRKEEMKVIQKANKIRETGKIPPTCLCF